MLALFMSVMMVLSMNGFTVLAADAGTEESEPQIVGEALTEEPSEASDVQTPEEEEPVLPEEEEPSSEESAAGEPEPQYAPDEEEIPEGATVEEAAEEPEEAADAAGSDATGADAAGSYAAEEAALDGTESERETVTDDIAAEPVVEESMVEETAPEDMPAVEEPYTYEKTVYKYGENDPSSPIVVTAVLDTPDAVPDQAELVVTPVVSDDTRYNYDAYMAALNGTADEEKYSEENTLLYDIAFLVPKTDENGAEQEGYVEYQPTEGSVRISFKFKEEQLSQIGAEKAEDVEVMHLPLTDDVRSAADTTADATDISPENIVVDAVDASVNMDRERVAFEAEGLSVFAFTVDFHYNGVDYSIAGMSQILLSELIEILQIKNGDTLLDVNDVEEVRFTDEHLVTVEEVSGLITIVGQDGKKADVDAGEKDFLLSSKKAFNTDEELTIVLLNGALIPVGVTDLQYVDVHLAGRKSMTLEEILGDNYKTNLVACFPTTDSISISGETISNLNSISYTDGASVWIYDWDSGEYVYYVTFYKDYIYGLTETCEIPLETLKESLGITDNVLTLSQVGEQYNDIYFQGGLLKVRSLEDFPADGIVLKVTFENYATAKYGILLVDARNPEPDPYNDGVFVYEINDEGNAEIVSLFDRYNGNGEITIQSAATVIAPDGTVETYPVVAIQNGAFEGENRISKVTFNNENALTVSDGAFSRVSSLTSIEFNGSGTVSVGRNDWNGAFAYCSNLETITGTGSGAVSFNAMGMFNNCSKLTSVSLRHIEHIAQNTFMDNNALRTVEAETIDRIDWQAFNRCRGLQLVHSSNVPSVSGNAFSGCNPEGILTLQFDAISESSIALGDVVRDSDGENCIHGKIAIKIDNTGSISIPANMVDSYADLVSVEIIGPVSEIAANAFSGCTGLTSVSIGGAESDTVVIKEGAFSGCTALTNFSCTSGAKLENKEGIVEYEAGTAKLAWLSVESVNEDDPSVAAIVENDAVTALIADDYTVEYYNICLTDVRGDEVHSEADVVWNKTISWKTSMEGQIPDVRLYHLKNNNTVEKVSVTSGIENNVLSGLAFTSSFSGFALAYNSPRYHDDTFYYDLIEKDGKVTGAVITGIYDKSATEIEFTSATKDKNAYPVSGIGAGILNRNSTVTRIVFSNDEAFSVADSAFQSMSALISVAFNGKGLVTVGENDWSGAFASCPSLTTVEGTGSVSFIPMGTFQYCDNLETVSLNQIGLIGQNTFIDNNALITFEADSVGEIAVQAFNRINALKSVKINGDVGLINGGAFDGCRAIESFIILGHTGTMKGSAVNSADMRVAVFKGGISKMERLAFSGDPFGQDNNLIYVGSVGGNSSLDGYGFGGSSQRGNGYFNVTYDQLSAALGGSPYSRLMLKNYHYADQEYDEDVYVSENAYSYDYGTKTEPYYSFSRAMGSLYYRTNTIDRFEQDCEKAGVSDLGLVFNGDLKPGVDGFVLHVMQGGVGRSQTVTTVAFPEDLYGGYVDSNSLSDAPPTYKYIKGIVFENALTDITIPAGAMKKFPNLTSVEVKNADAVVTIGADAFKDTMVNTICPAKQIVNSAAGTVTLEKGVDAPIGTALMMSDSTGDIDNDIKRADPCQVL